MYFGWVRLGYLQEGEEEEEEEEDDDEEEAGDDPTYTKLPINLRTSPKWHRWSVGNHSRAYLKDRERGGEKRGEDTK